MEANWHVGPSDGLVIEDHTSDNQTLIGISFHQTIFSQWSFAGKTFSPMRLCWSICLVQWAPIEFPQIQTTATAFFDVQFIHFIQSRFSSLTFCFYTKTLQLLAWAVSMNNSMASSTVLQCAHNPSALEQSIFLRSCNVEVLYFELGSESLKNGYD